jgi:hypothetical protein
VGSDWVVMEFGGLNIPISVVFVFAMLLGWLFTILPVLSLRLGNAISRMKRDKPRSTKFKIIWCLFTFSSYVGLYYFLWQSGTFDVKEQ